MCYDWTMRRQPKLDGSPLSLSKMEEKNPSWKGNSVGYTALHNWIKSRLPKPVSCSNCGKKKAIDLANISQKYKRDLFDWEWLCRSCHMIKDGRMAILRVSHPKRKGKTIICVICGQKKYRSPSQFNTWGGKYCSNSCSGIGGWPKQSEKIKLGRRLQVDQDRLKKLKSGS